MLSVGSAPFRKRTQRCTSPSRRTGVWEIEDGSVEVYNVITGKPRTMEGIDSVLFASGGVPDDARGAALVERVAVVHMIGDCYQPREIEVAVVDELRAGRAIGNGGA